jgi:hypothetical protein
VGVEVGVVEVLEDDALGLARRGDERLPYVFERSPVVAAR